jgi:predicted transcriptional regulator
MRVVWQHDVVTAEEVGQDLERPLKDSTIRTVLRRLEETGYVEPNSSFRDAKEPFARPVCSSSSGVHDPPEGDPASFIL